MVVRKGFALDPDSWKNQGKWISELNLNWRHVGFLGTAVPSIPKRGGVYAVCLKSTKYVSDKKPWSDWTAPMYIGRSVNLRSRFEDHVRGNYPATRDLALRFKGLEYWFTVIQDFAIQQDLEARLIDLFGPPMNRVHPAFEPILATLGDPIEINLPNTLYS